ncbi:MAG: glycosyltransferase [Cyclobacteriaceae bacterium]
MELSVIIPTKDRGGVFEHSLRSAIDATSHLLAEIIVVNDSKTSKPIISNIERIKLLNNPKAGVASARNLGVANSNGNILLFLDDDVVISKQSVDHVIKLHNDHFNACFNLNWVYPPELESELDKNLFGRFLQKHGMNHFKGWYNDEGWRDNALFPSKSVSSFHLSIARKDFYKTKGYNETFPHAGFEDYDFPHQLKKAGIRFYIDSQVVVYHNEVDRLNFSGWINNQHRRAVTRKVAVDLGYTELKIEYGFMKKRILAVLTIGTPLMLILLELMPNYKMFDRLYSKLLSVIIAIKIFNGYNSPIGK